jgi:hypothetical protein
VSCGQSSSAVAGAVVEVQVAAKRHAGRADAVLGPQIQLLILTRRQDGIVMPIVIAPAIANRLYRPRATSPWLPLQPNGQVENSGDESREGDGERDCVTRHCVSPVQVHGGPPQNQRTSRRRAPVSAASRGRYSAGTPSHRRPVSARPCRSSRLFNGRAGVTATLGSFCLKSAAHMLATRTAAPNAAAAIAMKMAAVMSFPMSHRSYRWKEHLEAGALLSRTASDLKAAVDLPDERLHHP